MSLDTEIERILVRTTEKLADRRARNDGSDMQAVRLVEALKAYIQTGRPPVLMGETLTFEDCFLDEAEKDLPWRIPFSCIAPEAALRYLRQQGPETFASYLRKSKEKVIKELQRYGNLSGVDPKA